MINVEFVFSRLTSQKCAYELLDFNAEFDRDKYADQPIVANAKLLLTTLN